MENDKKYELTKVSSMLQSRQSLIIDPRFDSLLNKELPAFLPNAPAPDPNDKKGNQRSQIRQQHRDQLKHLIQSGQMKISRFAAWRSGADLILIDGQHDLYTIVTELGVDYEYDEYTFATYEDARDFLIRRLLVYHPTFSAGQKILLALQMLPAYEKRAQENQGRRNDRLSESEKSTNSVRVDKELAAMAGVGVEKFNHIKQLWKEAQKPHTESAFALSKDGRARDLVAGVLSDEISVNQAWRKLKDARDKKKEKEDFEQRRLKKELAALRLQKKTESTENASFSNLSDDTNQSHEPKLTLVHDDSEGSIEVIGDDSNASSYTNPDMSQGYENKIFCGNNLSLMKKFPSNVAALEILSPDYNVNGVEYDVEIPPRPYAEYLEELGHLWVECARVLRDGGRLAINIASVTTQFEGDRNRAYNTPILSDLINQIESLNIGLKHRTTIIWNKRHCFNPYIPKGTTASARSPFIATAHEYILIFSKKSWTLEPTIQGAPSDLTTDENREWCQSVWNIVPQSPKRGDHPCPFPQEIPERLIKIYSFVGDLVIDPCNGSGSTTAAAAKLGRRWLGMDLSPKYCAHAQSRTEAAYEEYLKNLERSTATTKNKNASAPDTAA
jgi:site-specific DNA-methyltransferase (adenine-specific)